MSVPHPTNPLNPTADDSGSAAGQSTEPKDVGPALVPDLPPELIDHPQYQVVRELGRGGMGVVYLARNKMMDRLEVLKVVFKRHLDRPGSAARFVREIQSAARLNHPNVVIAYSVLQLGEVLVFAMEYVPGDDLAKLVKAHGPLPVLNACFYISQAAAGLQHAHDRGMIHRDIKPHNLILARDKKKHLIKILDFGLAKAATERADNDTAAGPDVELTVQGALLGSPAFIAPEQTRDASAADIRADIYSLGCTLHYLLVGKPPFWGVDVFELVRKHREEYPAQLNWVRPDVHEEVAGVVWKMLAKDPARRFQTPAEVINALAPFSRPGGKPTPTP